MTEGSLHGVQIDRVADNSLDGVAARQLVDNVSVWGYRNILLIFSSMLKTNSSPFYFRLDIGLSGSQFPKR